MPRSPHSRPPSQEPDPAAPIGSPEAAVDVPPSDEDRTDEAAQLPAVVAPDIPIPVSDAAGDMAVPLEADHMGEEQNADTSEDEEEERPPKVVLVALSGPEDGRVFAMIHRTAKIGRLASDVTVELRHDLWVSRHHAQLTYHDGQWWLKDIGSSNGTWLSQPKQQVQGEEEPLALGQIFRTGHTDLMLSEDPDLILQASTLL